MEADGRTTRSWPTDRLARGFQIAAFSAAIAALLFLAWNAKEVFLLGFAGLLVGVLLASLAEVLNRHTSLPYKVSLGVVLIILIGIAAGVIWVAGHRIAGQFHELRTVVPSAAGTLKDYLSTYQVGDWLLGQLQTSSAYLGEGRVVSQLSSAAYKLVDILVGLMIVLFVGVYLAFEPQLYRDGLLRLVPVRHRDRGQQVISEVTYTLRWWLVGQLASMTVIGLLFGGGSWMLGVPLALTLGVIAFALEFIPRIGPIARGAVWLFRRTTPVRARRDSNMR